MTYIFNEYILIINFTYKSVKLITAIKRTKGTKGTTKSLC